MAIFQDYMDIFPIFPFLTIPTPSILRNTLFFDRKAS